MVLYAHHIDGGAGGARKGISPAWGARRTKAAPRLLALALLVLPGVFLHRGPMMKRIPSSCQSSSCGARRDGSFFPGCLCRSGGINIPVCDACRTCRRGALGEERPGSGRPSADFRSCDAVQPDRRGVHDDAGRPAAAVRQGPPTCPPNSSCTWPIRPRAASVSKSHAMTLARGLRDARAGLKGLGPAVFAALVITCGSRDIDWMSVASSGVT